MTMPTRLTAQLHLAADAVNAASRTIAGVIVPYGVVGQTSLGPITVDAGAVQLPEDLGRVKLFSGHDREVPIGYLASVEDSSEQLSGSFTIGTTPAAELALQEAAEGLRDGLSVELDTLTFSDDETRVTDSQLRGVGLVTVPAFDDSRVATVAAAHNEGDDTMPPTPTTEPQAAQGALSAPAADQGGQGAAAADALAAAAAPQGLQGAARTNPRPVDLQEFYSQVTAAHRLSRGQELTAALSDITQANNSAVDDGQVAGQLWQGVRYQRRVIPKLSSGTLTSYAIRGWRWATKPEVADYSGNKTDVPSNAADTEAVSQAAARMAGAHDFDRKFIDFNDTAFIQAYYEAMTESYAIKTDAKAVDLMEAAATDLTPVNDGLFAAIAEGAAAIDAATGAGASFAIVNPATLLTELLPLTNFDVPAYLQLLGVNVDSIVTHSAMTAGHVLVGAQAAVTWYELPGSPIRVEAVDMAKGGVDEGVFGYYGLLVNDADGLQDVTIGVTP